VFLPAVPADGTMPEGADRQAIYTIEIASGRVTRVSP
jgi:hypothetical protein